MGGVLRDSTNGFDIPLDNLAAVGGYGDGAISQWTSAMWARFDDPAITKLVIVVNPLDVGDIADVERGAIAPADVPGWVRRFNRPARRAPTVYVNRSNWPAVTLALQQAGFNPATIDWWVATLDGTLDVYFGQPGTAVPFGMKVAAVQWKGEALTGGHYDESVILDPSWLGVPQEEEMAGPLMFAAPPPAAGQQPQPGLFVSGDLVLEIPFDGVTTDAIAAQGVKTVTGVSQQFFDSLRAAGVARGTVPHTHFSSTTSSTTGGVVPGP